MKQEPKHWYLLAFMVQHPGMWAPSSFLLGSESVNLTIPQINNAKLLNKIPNASVLIGTSYLGYQSERVINGQEDLEAPSVLTEAYQKGVAAAMEHSMSAAWQPSNPYVKGSMDNHDRADEAEWQRGFDSIRALQKANHARVTPPEELPNVNGQAFDKPTEVLAEKPERPAKKA